MRQEIERSLLSLFDAERTCRSLHDSLSERPADELLDVLEGALAAAMKESREEEVSLRLVRIAGLLGELEGPRAVDLLIDVLASEHPEARSAAGRELGELAFDRFKEVAKGVERALKRLPAGSPALPELPYILAEIPEPGVMKLLGQFLAHSDPDAVAASIEALVELGDPAAIKLIAPLAGDKRSVELADEESEGESAEVTLGELAEEAIDILSENEDDEPGAGAGRKQ